MRIKIYIVAYNSDNNLKKNLDLIEKSDIKNFNYSIHIINNYGLLDDSFRKNYHNVEVLNNVLRPDFSRGHLSRSWNQGIINGFKSLNSPDCDILILMQNDTFVKINTFSRIVKYSEIYDFIQIGGGDQMTVYKPEAIKKIGIFDERFCSIGFQEADYFLNAVILHPNKSSINDYVHNRIHNPIPNDIIENIFSQNKNAYSYDICEFHNYNDRLFNKKWNTKPEHWNQTPTSLIPLIERYMTYPYFEKDIETLKEQKYFI